MTVGMGLASRGIAPRQGQRVLRERKFGGYWFATLQSNAGSRSSVS
jgi:hypothetical protein